MEPTERKTAFGGYKYLGNISVPTIGIALLTIVGLQFWRSAGGGLELLELASITLGIAVVGLAYYKQRRALNQLDGTIDDKTLSGLCQAANSMAVFGYLICVMALTSLRHR